jgi:hypothetical protein
MATTNNPPQSLLTEHDVARITGLSVSTVRRWRLLNQGPPYLKINSTVRYQADSFSLWLASRPKGGELVPEVSR